jgi:hypothetical protein
LTPHGAPIRLPVRPIHLSTDIPPRNLLVAFNNPSAIRIYRINQDFTPGKEVRQPDPIDPGIFAHQARVTPDGAPRLQRALHVATLALDEVEQGFGIGPRIMIDCAPAR